MTRLLTRIARRAAVDPIWTVSWRFAATRWDWPAWRVPSNSGSELSGSLTETQAAPPLALTRTSNSATLMEKVAELALAETNLTAGLALVVSVAGLALALGAVVGASAVTTGPETPLLV